MPKEENKEKETPKFNFLEYKNKMNKNNQFKQQNTPKGKSAPKGSNRTTRGNSRGK
jgi:hypothetical protein